MTATLLSLLCFASASATTIDSPGTYSVTFVAWSALVPPELIPPGTPTVGPTVYEGTLRINRNGRGFNAVFQGDSFDGHRINVSASFDSNWRGVRTEMVPVNGGIVDAIVNIDAVNLRRGHLNGTVLADGFTRRVQIRVGPGGELRDLRVN